MADKRISELVVATSSLSTDQLVIRRDSSNFSLAVGLVSTSGSSGTPTDTGSLVTTSSISGTTQTFTKGDGSTYTNEIVSASYAETASFAASSDTSELSSSLAFTITNNSESAATALTNQSSSASTAREALDTSITNNSASAATALTNQSSSASTAREALNTSITNLSSSVSTDITALSSSASTAREAISASSATALTNYSSSHAVYLNSNFIQTVNAVGPDANGNVGVSLTSVSTGLSSSFPATPTDGDVYVISGETAPDRTGSNGESFIYSDDSSDWFRLSGLDLAGQDARYVNQSGDTMTGNLFLNGDPTLANQASTKQYTDLFYDSSSFDSSGNVLQLHKGNSTIDSITIVSSSHSVTSSHAITASHALDAVSSSYAITASHAVTASFAQTASSVLHLEQDVFISGTLYQSGSIDMNNFTINNVDGPYENEDASTKKYVDDRKLDTIYNIFDLELSPTFGKTYSTGQAFMVETFVSASIPFIASQGNNGSTLQVRRFNTGSEDVSLVATAPVTSQFPRASGLFVSASDYYITTINNAGTFYLHKFDGSSITVEQTITGFPGCTEQLSHVTAQETNNENNAIACYSAAGSGYQIVRFVSGSYETSVSEVISVTGGGNLTNTTHAVHFEGDYYITLWNETDDRREIWKYDFEDELATRAMIFPTMTGGGRHGGVLMISQGRLFEAHGQQSSPTELYEIDVTNSSYRLLKTFSYTTYGIYADTLGEIDDENEGTYYITATSAANTMQHIRFNAATLETEELGVKATGTWVQTPRFIKANSQLYPIVGAYTSNRYDIQKLVSDYQAGDVLVADSGNWKTSSDLITGIQLPTGTTLERPINASQGSIRFNTNTQKVEFFNSASNWISL